MRELGSVGTRTGGIRTWLGLCGAAALALPTAPAGAQQDGQPWVRRADMGVARTGHQTVGVGPTDEGIVIVLGGVAGGQVLDSVEMYDPRLDRWQALPSLPEPRVDFGAALCDEEDIIVAGGFEDAAMTQLAEEAFAFNLDTQQWRTIAPPPVRRGAPGMAASDDGRVFLAGGAPALRTVDEYSCFEDRWMTMPSMIVGRQKPAVAFIEAELYVMGGRTTRDPNIPNATLDTVEAFTFLGTWETRAPMPTPRSDFTVINLGDEFGLAVGGTDGLTPLSQVDIYGVDANVWSPAGPLPVRVQGGMGGSFPFDTTGFFTGGGPAGSPSAQLFVFDALRDPRLEGEEFGPLRGEEDFDDDDGD